MYYKRIRHHLVCGVNGNQRERWPALNENEKEKCEDNGKEKEVYYEPAKRDSNGMTIGCI